MKHPRPPSPQLVVQARPLVWYHVEKVPREVIQEFLAWCAEKEIHAVKCLGGRASRRVISLPFDAADSYAVSAWFEAKGITVRRYESPPQKP